jgi:hypothetical protein
MLQNNSLEMNTIVETFIIEETVELIYDNEKLGKWNDLVKELGLSGQTQLVKPEKSPIPFMHLKTGLKNILETLCPRKEDVKNYNITPIPVEILDLIMLSKREGYFTKIQVWYDERNPDPCCVGTTSEFQIYQGYVKNLPEYICKTYPTRDEAYKVAKEYDPELSESKTIGWDTNEKYYLLGKWADIKHSFDDLKTMATKRFVEEKGNEFRKQIKEAERGLIDLETEAFDKFN